MKTNAILAISCLLIATPLVAGEGSEPKTSYSNSRGKKPVPAAKPKPAVSVTPKPVLLSAGDPIRIELKQPAEQSVNYNATYHVKAAGTLMVPLLAQPIQAAGLTPDQLARLLEKNYTEAGVLKDPVFAVEKLPIRDGIPDLVVVKGSVKSGGREVPLRNGMRLYNAVKSAGGFDESADFSRVKLTRGGKATIYDLGVIKTEGSNNPLLKDGDSVFVPKSMVPKTKPKR